MSSTVLVERDRTYVGELCCAARCPRPHTVEVTVRVAGRERSVRMCDRHAEPYLR